VSWRGLTAASSRWPPSASTAVGIREFEAMRERLTLLEDIARAEAQLAAGEGIPHEEAKARILNRIDA